MIFENIYKIFVLNLFIFKNLNLTLLTLNTKFKLVKPGGIKVYIPFNKMSFSHYLH